MLTIDIESWRSGSCRQGAEWRSSAKLTTLADKCYWQTNVDLFLKCKEKTLGEREDDDSKEGNNESASSRCAVVDLFN